MKTEYPKDITVKEYLDALSNDKNSYFEYQKIIIITNIGVYHLLTPNVTGFIESNIPIDGANSMQETFHVLNLKVSKSCMDGNGCLLIFSECFEKESVNVYMCDGKIEDVLSTNPCINVEIINYESDNGNGACYEDFLEEYDLFMTKNKTYKIQEKRTKVKGKQKNG